MHNLLTGLWLGGGNGDGMQLVWLFGAPGVGKSTATWQLFGDLTSSGLHCAYVDIDQIGMCYPAPVEDPDQHRLKGTVLASLLANYGAAGAEVLLVSGVLDPSLIPWLTGELGVAGATFRRLTLSEERLRLRLEERGGDGDDWDAVRRADRELDVAMPTGPRVSTDGLSPQQVADAVRASVEGLTAPSARRGNRALPGGEPTHVSISPGTVTALCGAGGVGKSAVAWQIFLALQEGGTTVAFLDLQQLGFVPGDVTARHRVQAANVAAAWDCFAAGGAAHLVLSGSLDNPEQVRQYRDALPATKLTVYRLRADREDLVSRIQARGRGEGPRLAGDQLVNQPPDVLEQAVAAAWQQQRRLDAADVADAVVDSSGAGATEVATRVLRARPNGGGG